MVVIGHCEKAGVYCYQNDHLGTPQRLLDKNGAVVWVATYSAFGRASVTANIVGNNLRFPGQYYDGESGLHYNYFRDYDPGTGRYIQSDPIGLNGGINTYGYVEGNPTGKIDPMGLSSVAHPNRHNPIDFAGGAMGRTGRALAGGLSIAQIINVLSGKPANDNASDSSSSDTSSDSSTGEQCEEEDNNCPPCDPPAGEKYNKVTHYTSHSADPNKGTYGCMQLTGSPVHWHYSVMHQNKDTCQCFEQKHAFGGCGVAPP